MTNGDVATEQSVDRNEADDRTVSYWLGICISLHVVPITITNCRMHCVFLNLWVFKFFL